MSFTATITKQLVQADVTARQFRCPVQVVITAGTYPAGGILMGLAALYSIGVSSAVPNTSVQFSVANPPSGIVWAYNATTDKLQAFVPAGSGAQLAEFSGTINADVVDVEQSFNRY